MSTIAKRRVVEADGITWQPTEEEEQAAVIEWAVLMAKQYPELDLLFHVPNGADRHPAVAAKLKRQGVKRGVPDLFLPVARQGFYGLWIEMKRQKGGRVSDEQKAWMDALRGQGYMCAVCKGAEEACEVLFWYLTGGDNA